MKPSTTVLILGIGLLLGTSSPGQNIPEIHYLQFNEGTGTMTADLAAPGLTGSAPTLNGAASWNTATPALGNASLTSGSASTDICRTNTLFSVTGDWTIECWLTATVPGTNTGLGYFFGENSAGGFRAFRGGVAGVNNVILRGGGLLDVTVVGGDAGIGVQTHVAWVHDSVAGTVTPYLNGVAQAPVSTTVPSITGTDPLGFSIGGHGSTPYQGDVDEFRFWNQARTAADMLNFYNVELSGALQPIDMRVASIDGPADSQSDCAPLTSFEVVSFTVQNFGLNPLPAGTPFTGFYTSGGGTLTAAEGFTTTTNLMSFATESFSFVTPIDLSISGTYSLDVGVSLPGDTNPTNDISTRTVVSGGGVSPVSSFPWTESFDAFGAASGGTMPPPLWEQDQADGVGTDSDWYFLDGPTPTANTGPPADHSTGVAGAGFYAYVEDSTGNFAAVNLLSPCLDLATVANPVLTFWMHSHDALGGTNQNSLSVDVISFTTGTTTMDVFGPQGDFGHANWELQVVPLGAFAGQLIRLRLRGSSSAGSAHDVAIDDVQVIDLVVGTGQAPQPGAAVFDLNGAVDVNGFAVSAGFNGPFTTTVSPGSALDFEFEGAPNQPILLLAGPTTPFLLSLGAAGQLDLGSGIDAMTGLPLGVVVIGDGTQLSLPNFFFRTQLSGHTRIRFPMPAFPTGYVTTFQPLIFTGGPSVIAAGNAIELLAQ
ncbi:MAG: hypothetical protein KDB53_21870 [Planctomycetes bacterium]|nr:hypothetical protein [Planctomycetota bacterium]